MKRVTNCVLFNREHQEILFLQKPSKGWWVAPGGKMERNETILESVLREYKEETGLILLQPELRGVFTIIIQDGSVVVEEWMLFTFFADQYKGHLLETSREGKLAWHHKDTIAQLLKPHGDQLFLEHIMNETEMLIMKFWYTPDYQLLKAE